MEQHTEKLDGAEPPFCWIQDTVTVVTHSEEITGCLMTVVGDLHMGVDSVVVHDQDTSVDVPVWIPRSSISSIIPIDMAEALKERIDQEVAAFEEEEPEVFPMEPEDLDLGDDDFK